MLSTSVQDLFSHYGTASPGPSELRGLLYGEGIHPQISREAELLLRDSVDITSFSENAKLYKRGSAPERLAFYTVSRLLDPDAAERRRAMLTAFPADNNSPLDGLILSRDTGVSVVAPQNWSMLEDAVSEAEEGFRISDGQTTVVNPGKTFMSTARMSIPFFDSCMLKLARHPSLLRLVGNYLDCFPILYRINLLRSSNEYIQDGSSQFFHLDPEDFRQVKVFILISDVDENSGPLHLLSANATDEFRVQTGYRHSRLHDEEVFSVVGDGGLTRCSGPRGTMAIGDTSRCLHFGSRPGNRERFVAMIQYITPFASSFSLVPDAISSKYSEPFRQRCDVVGMTPTEEDLCLFGLKR